MANNRMLLVCNKCFPPKSNIWENGPELWDNVCSLGKWYPGGSYETYGDNMLGQRVNSYLTKHAHMDDVVNRVAKTPEEKAAFEHNENPVRLIYETHSVAIPAIKKWRV